MPRSHPPSVRSTVARGVVSGVAGTAVMTAFQRLVEMPLTQRGESYAPADLAETVTPLHPHSAQGRRRLNEVTHYSLGLLWGAAHAAATLQGLRGQRAVHAAFAVVYTGDVLLNTALGLYRPWRWSAQDLVVDVVDKYVQAQATGAVFELLAGRRA